MNFRVLAVFVGLAALSLHPQPAFARSHKPAPAASPAKASHKVAEKKEARKTETKKSEAKKLAAKNPARKSGTKQSPEKKREAKKPEAKKSTAKNAAPKKPDTEKSAGSAAHGYAAMPDAQRRLILSDLTWLGHYEGAAFGDFDESAIDAIKSFQRHNGGKDTGILTDQEGAALAAAVKAPQDAVGWRLIDDATTGARLGLPSKLVPQAGASRSGSSWSSGHGQIQIETFRLHEAALPALFDQEKKAPRQRSVGSSALKANSFVITGTQGLKDFLVRAESSGAEVRGIIVLYDQATAGIMAPVAVAIANSFQGFPDQISSSPGQKRSVEYGTAIVVDGAGNLIASGPVTDQCAAITVPGFGHADRIAADAASGLALLRLYGARNLAPAALAGDSGGGAGGGGGGNTGDDLTLIGIADPTAQAGAAAVTHAAGHRGAQGFIEPAPKPGFSGAAALDGQNRFAGIVGLNPPSVAGAASGLASQASLISADSVRAFLKAQGIAPAGGGASGGNGTAAMDQSVLRVICVRK
jgi:hypothetical protein